MTLLINLYGGPGSGKSTTAAGVFHKLKLAGVNCEMALEYAKDKVWEGSEQILHNQLYVFGQQYHRIWRLLDKVDVIITDSPILLSILYYKDYNSHFINMVIEEHKKLDTLDVFIKRVKKYNPAGRLQNEKEAKKLDTDLKQLLYSTGTSYMMVTGDESAVEDIVVNAFLRIKA